MTETLRRGLIAPIDLVVARLDEYSGPTRGTSRTGFTAHCPAHDDRSPSLSVSEGRDGRVLLHCHAGCPTEQVLDAMDLTWADLHAHAANTLSAVPKPAEHPPKRQEFVYRSLAGDPVLMVLRTNLPDGTKRISQHRRLGDAWVSGVKGRVDEDPVVPIPYHLPELVAGIGADALVLIVEGETCVEAAESLGFVATTNAGGAGKFRREWASLFKGARVAILPDNDTAGQQHAHQVHDVLRQVCEQIAIVDLPGLPSSGDLVDFIAAGGNATDVKAQIDRQFDSPAHVANVAAITASEHDQTIETTTVPTLDDAALLGPIGDIVNHLAPTTEASKPALLAVLVTEFGAMIGGHTVANIWGDPQPGNLFTILAGASGAARKSTAARAIRTVLKHVDADFTSRIEPGLASGEAIIDALRDDNPDGAGDRRMLIHEDEFARLLTITARQGNTLLPTLLTAWDSADLSIRSKRDGRIHASSPHIAIVGNIPTAELRKSLHGFTSGFASRFLYVVVDSPRDLPFPPRLSAREVARMVRPLSDAFMWASEHRELGLAPASRAAYEELYLDHRRFQRSDNLQSHALRAREVSHLVRIALIQAVSMRANYIEAQHLEAAAAIVAYGNASIDFLFGVSPALSKQARRALDALQRSPTNELSRSELRAVFTNNLRGGEIDAILTELRLARLISEHRIPGQSGGRPTQVVRLASPQAPRSRGHQ